MSQIGSFPQVGVKMNNVSNYHLEHDHTTHNPNTTNLPTNQPTQPIKSSKKTQAIPPINTQKKTLSQSACQTITWAQMTMAVEFSGITWRQKKSHETKSRALRKKAIGPSKKRRGFWNLFLFFFPGFYPWFEIPADSWGEEIPSLHNFTNRIFFE